jgi:hypothetical protein
MDSAQRKGRVSAQFEASNRVRSERKQHHEPEDVPRKSGSLPTPLNVTRISLGGGLPEPNGELGAAGVARFRNVAPSSA